MICLLAFGLAVNGLILIPSVTTSKKCFTQQMKMPLRFISELFCSSCTHSTVQVISPTIISVVISIASDCISWESSSGSYCDSSSVHRGLDFAGACRGLDSFCGSSHLEHNSPGPSIRLSSSLDSCGCSQQLVSPCTCRGWGCEPSW